MSGRTNTISERAGAAFGRAWRKLQRYDARAALWMSENGASPFIAKTLLWTVKIVALAVLLWLAFWIAVLLVIAVMATFLLRNADQPHSGRVEQRDGPLGFGLYDEHGFRIDLDDDER